MSCHHCSSMNSRIKCTEMSIYAWPHSSKIWQSKIRDSKSKRVWSRYLVTRSPPQRNYSARKLFSPTYSRYLNDWIYSSSITHSTNTKDLYQDQKIYCRQRKSDLPTPNGLDHRLACFAYYVIIFTCLWRQYGQLYFLYLARIDEWIFICPNKKIERHPSLHFSILSYFKPIYHIPLPTKFSQVQAL